MICFGTVFGLLLLCSSTAFAFGGLLSPRKCCLAVASGPEDEEGFNFGFEADAGCWNGPFAPLFRLGWLDPGVGALAQGFCWLVLNLDASTLADWFAASPGLGKIAGDGDP